MNDPAFTSLERFHINQRGWMHIVALPDELWNASHSPKLAGKYVRIDGELRKVRGVMMPCIDWRPGAKAFKTVGLLIEGH